MAAKFSSLPERLKYLQPFRKKFASKPPKELNEDTGVEPLMKLLAKRLAGLPDNEAKALIQADLAEMEGWLASPENQNDSLQFVRGFFLVSDDEVPRLVREWVKDSAAPALELQIKLPPKAKTKAFSSRNGVGMVVRWKGTITAIDVVDRDAFKKFQSRLAQPSTDLTRTTLQVSFGPVSGTKFLETGVTWLGPVKDLEYLLEVPGGLIHLSSSVISKKIDPSKWDESELEACLATLRIIHPHEP